MFGLNTSGSDFNQKSGQISNIEEVDFLNLFLVNEDVNDVEKSKDINIEIDILNDTKDKAPDPWSYHLGARTNFVGLCFQTD